MHVVAFEPQMFSQHQQYLIGFASGMLANGSCACAVIQSDGSPLNLGVVDCTVDSVFLDRIHPVQVHCDRHGSARQHVLLSSRRTMLVGHCLLELFAERFVDPFSRLVLIGSLGRVQAVQMDFCLVVPTGAQSP
jgi:hypothetical protein